MMVTQVFQAVQESRSFCCTEAFEDFRNDISKIFLLEWNVQFQFLNRRFHILTRLQEVLRWNAFCQVGIVWLLKVWKLCRHDIVKEDLTNSCQENLVLLRFCPWFVQAICRNSDTCMQVNIAIAKGHDRFITVFEDHAFAFTTSFFHSEVVVPQYHILRWGNDWFTVFWIQDVLSSQHQDTSFCLGFF